MLKIAYLSYSIQYNVIIIMIKIVYNSDNDKKCFCFFKLNFAMFFVLSVYSREKCQSMPV